MSNANIKISKTISFILRHGPDKFGLILDKQGFVEITELAKAMCSINADRQDMTVETAVKMIRDTAKNCPKGRFEIAGSMIRAKWGHTVSIETGECSEPPEYLYHGTSPEAFEEIIKTGIKKMARRFVHMSADEQTAISTGKRHSSEPVLLRILAKKLWLNGVNFYNAGNNIWLAEEIKPAYIENLMTDIITNNYII
mgnify:CR=1 FL=1